MNDDLESRLRRALRPVEPSEGFANRLLLRIDAVRAADAAALRAARSRRPPAGWWLAAGLAASMVLAAAVQLHVREQRQHAAGLEARRQVIDALRVTDGILERASAVVQQSPAVRSDAEPSS